MSEQQLEVATIRKRDRRSTSSDPDDEDQCVQEVIATIQDLLPREPSLAAVASALGLSVRTLQRRLSARGLTYRSVLDDVRRRLAEVELCRGERSIAEVSRSLGYSDPAHFVRAFRRWTGQPPSRYERSKGSGGGAP